MSVWPLSMSIQCSVNQKKKLRKKKSLYYLYSLLKELQLNIWKNIFGKGRSEEIIL